MSCIFIHISSFQYFSAYLLRTRAVFRWFCKSSVHNNVFLFDPLELELIFSRWSSAVQCKTGIYFAARLAATALLVTVYFS